MGEVFVFIVIIVAGAGWYSLSRRVTRLTRDVEWLKARLAPDTGETPRQASAPAAPEPREEKRPETPPDVRGWVAQRPKTPPPQPADARPESPTPERGKRDGEGGGLEQALGTRWTVWIGGLALAFGAIFLVQYSVQQGLIGPGVRIFLGVLLSAVLLAAGEMLRRRPDIVARSQADNVPIPPILTATGCIAGYATIYAAYALYGMLSPGVAFLLLGVVSLATILLSGVHASYLAAIGLLGSVLTPALITSDAPQPEVLFLYLTFVIGAAIATAELRQWRWLNYAAIAASLVWPLIWLVMLWVPGDEIVIALHLLALYGFQLFWAWDEAQETGKADFLSPPSVAAAITGFLVMLFLFAADHEAPALAGFAAYILLSIGAGWRRAGFAPAVAISAPFAVAGLGLWAIPRAAWDQNLSTSITHYFTQPLLSEALTSYLVASALAALLYGGAGYLKQVAGTRQKGWAAAATFVPLTLFTIAYARTELLETSISWAFLALILAILHAGITQQLNERQRGSAAGDFAIALYAGATLGFLALTFAIAFRNEWLTIALSLLVPGIASIRRHLNVPVLEKIAVFFGGVVLVRLLFNPYLPDYDIGTTPIFNVLLYTYGLPAAFTGLGALLFRREGLDRTANYLEQVALVLGFVLIHLEINHAFNDGDAFRFPGMRYSLAEHGYFLIVWLTAALALMKWRLHVDRPHYRWMTKVLFGLSYVGIFFGVFVMSPLHSTIRFNGPLFFDAMMLAYLVPALLAALCVVAVQKLTPGRKGLGMALASAIAGFAYYSLEIRRLFHEGSIALRHVPVTEAESYSYSLAWLVLGGIMLAAAFVTRRQMLRVGSLCLIILVVGKVFLLDMSGLSGILRAASFLGLGAALIGIGLFYQRMVFRKAPGSD
ncbi:putative membrane protein [Parvibaculum indicum]|uniref:DUF2339 domain-containing protein n=1 Tax=Parvibaculum indicum TaxID=562969 RepID=UPI0014204E11|nr:DUF2339 domain-containing protein [Parvibaculum indicum]NIJ41704.1 putative membrane protein [Parvibaculum indicum]